MSIHSEHSKFEKISVLGLGYIGLPTAAILAARKITVIGVDINLKAVESVNRGEVHFIEPDLDIIVHAAVSEGYLRATTQPEPADVFIIAVPTPFKSGYEPDLCYVKAASQSIASVLKKGDLVILESTSPVSATEQMAEWLAQARSDLTFPQTHQEDSDIRIAYCPERVMPGHVLRELVQNDRIIGGMTTRCSELARQMYRIFVEGECIVTNSRTAEMCKLTENSFRDVNIAFANELSLICDKFDIDVCELIRLANHHPRVNILTPGPGVGGHCIAVDPWFIVSQAPEKARLIRTAREVNDYKPFWVFEKIQLAIAQCLQKQSHKTARDITVVCLGLTFKANIDDLRESPALEITRKLAEIHPGPVFVVEPNVEGLPKILEGKVALKSLDEIFNEADVMIKLVNHTQFEHISEYITSECHLLKFCGD